MNPVCFACFRLFANIQVRRLKGNFAPKVRGLAAAAGWKKSACLIIKFKTQKINFTNGINLSFLLMQFEAAELFSANAILI